MRWKPRFYDRKKARAWMFEHDIRLVDIQRAVGHRTCVQTAETLGGIRNNRAVLNHLINLGCPLEYLDLPENFKRDKAA